MFFSVNLSVFKNTVIVKANIVELKYIYNNLPLLAGGRCN